MEEKEKCYWKHMYERKKITTIITEEANCRGCSGYDTKCKQYVRKDFPKKMLEGRI